MTKMTKLISSRKHFYLAFILLILGLSALAWYQNWQSRFTAPRQQARIVTFTIRKNTALTAVMSDLHYYGFIKDESAIKYALEQTKDRTPGTANAIVIGKNTIDREASYQISQSMTAWEIAAVLLNEGELRTCNHGCPDSKFEPKLLPGGDLAPTIKEKYSWVMTYDDCKKAIGSDGGQLSSTQSEEKTGIRRCVAPDGREFTAGQAGWSNLPTP